MLMALEGRAAEPGCRRPFEDGRKFETKNLIDRAVLSGLRKRGIKPANRCSDEIFVRRVYLDVIGTLPEPR